MSSAGSSLAGARATFVWGAIISIAILWVLRDIAVLVGYSVLLAYALLPVVRAIERIRDPWGHSLPPGVVAGGLMIALVATGGGLVVLAVPRIAAEAAQFVGEAPAVLARIIQGMHTYAADHQLATWVDPVIENLRVKAPSLVQQWGGQLVRATADAFGGFGNVLTLALLPLLAFYLLAESDAVRASALRFVPEGARPELSRLGVAVDRALRSYVRGQAIVCLVMGVTVGAVLALLHHPAALLLALVVGAAELIPYIGFMIAAVAIALAGSSVSPVQALLGLAVYTVANWAIGTFVTPRLMGRYLKMHPFVVTVSVLAGAQLLGPAGALLALPGAAVIQALIGELAPRGGGSARSRPAAPRAADA